MLTFAWQLYHWVTRRVRECCPDLICIELMKRAYAKQHLNNVDYLLCIHRPTVTHVWHATAACNILHHERSASEVHYRRDGLRMMDRPRELCVFEEKQHFSEAHWNINIPVRTRHNSGGRSKFRVSGRFASCCSSVYDWPWWIACW